MNQPLALAQCDTCRYWVRTEQIGRGICAHSPPQMVHLGNGQIQVLHPPTPATMTCGQHQPTALPVEDIPVIIEK